MRNKRPLILVEDDPIQRRILCAMLENDFIIQSFDSYQAAYDGLRDTVSLPDLILCDITLPDGNGLDLRQELLGHDRWVSCPFIFLSSRHDEKTKSRAAQLGIDDFLDKPITRPNLLTALERTLKRSETLKLNLNKRLDRELTEPMQPVVPETIGDYRLALFHQEVAAGGGDFVFHLPHGAIHYIVLGDVMGHGAPAKFFLHAYAGYLYGLFRSFRHHGLQPDAGDLLNLLNDAMAEDDFLKRWLMTCLVLCLPEQGFGTLANAGHPNPFLCTGHKVREIKNRGPMPGLLAGLSYKNEIIDLAPGERLYLATDGVSFDPARLCLLRDQTPDQAMHALMAQQEKREDDATLVIVERKPVFPGQ